MNQIQIVLCVTEHERLKKTASFLKRVSEGLFCLKNCIIQVQGNALGEISVGFWAIWWA